MTNPRGRFGIHGGQYIPETLMNAVIELEKAYEFYKKDPDFNRELTALFNELTDNPKSMTTSFEENYYTWLEYMYVSFIAHLEVPEYDKEANHQLAEIINTL